MKTIPTVPGGLPLVGHALTLGRNPARFLASLARYGDLVEAALPHCTELRFLNPGIDVCVAHCMSRPWEPEKFPTPEAQRATLDDLVRWVRDYESRDDEYGLATHRRIFETFRGKKREYSSVMSYMD